MLEMKEKKFKLKSSWKVLPKEWIKDKMEYLSLTKWLIETIHQFV